MQIRHWKWSCWRVKVPLFNRDLATQGCPLVFLLQFFFCNFTNIVVIYCWIWQNLCQLNQEIYRSKDCLFFRLLNIYYFYFFSEIKCGIPPVPVNARVKVSNEKLVAGTTATYTCDDGYELFGSSLIQCAPGGMWNGDLPFCGMLL